MRFPGTIEDRLKNGTQIRGRDECWIWLGSKNRNKAGYGRIERNGKKEVVHRIAYKIYYGIDPNDLCVCHTCDNSMCVNPRHLFLGTHADNMRDMKAKGRAISPQKLKTHCKRGHEFTKENTLPSKYGINKIGRKCKTCVRAFEKSRSKKHINTTRVKQ